MKVSTRYKDLENEDLDTSEMKVVSSAYCDILHSVSRILIPCILVSFLTEFPNTSAHKIKIRGQWASLPYSVA